MKAEEKFELIEIILYSLSENPPIEDSVPILLSPDKKSFIDKEFDNYLETLRHFLTSIEIERNSSFFTHYYLLQESSEKGKDVDYGWRNWLSDEKDEDNWQSKRLSFYSLNEEAKFFVDLKRTKDMNWGRIFWDCWQRKESQQSIEKRFLKHKNKWSDLISFFKLMNFRADCWDYYVNTLGDNPIHLLGREQLYRQKKLPNELKVIIESLLWEETFINYLPDCLQNVEMKHFVTCIKREIKANLYKNNYLFLDIKNISFTKEEIRLILLSSQDNLIGELVVNILGIIRNCNNKFLQINIWKWLKKAAKLDGNLHIVSSVDEEFWFVNNRTRYAELLYKKLFSPKMKDKIFRQIEEIVHCEENFSLGLDSFFKSQEKNITESLRELFWKEIDLQKFELTSIIDENYCRARIIVHSKKTNRKSNQKEEEVVEKIKFDKVESGQLKTKKWDILINLFLLWIIFCLTSWLVKRVFKKNLKKKRKAECLHSKLS